MIKILYDSLTKKYFQLSGRANKKEYWTIYLLGVFLCQTIVLFTLYYSEFIIQSFFLFFLFLLFLIVITPPFIANSIRRLHDLNLSGWWFLIISMFDIWTNDFFNNLTGGFIIANIPHFILGIVKGTPTTNKYGEPPTN